MSSSLFIASHSPNFTLLLLLLLILLLLLHYYYTTTTTTTLLLLHFYCYYYYWFQKKASDRQTDRQNSPLYNSKIWSSHFKLLDIISPRILKLSVYSSTWSSIENLLGATSTDVHGLKMTNFVFFVFIFIILVSAYSVRACRCIFHKSVQVMACPFSEGFRMDHFLRFLDLFNHWDAFCNWQIINIFHIENR